MTQQNLIITEFTPSGSSLNIIDEESFFQAITNFYHRKREIKHIRARVLENIFEFDVSSVFPVFIGRNDTYLIEKYKKIDYFEDILEYDIYIKMKPKTYTIELEITSVKKGKPTIVIPDEI